MQKLREALIGWKIFIMSSLLAAVNFLVWLGDFMASDGQSVVNDFLDAYLPSSTVHHISILIALLVAVARSYSNRPAAIAPPWAKSDGGA